MIFVDRNVSMIPSVFNSRELEIARRRLEQFYSKPEKSRSQQRYSQPFAIELANEIRISLKNVFKNKCAYCESLISEAITRGAIDHFRPKGGARGLEKEFSKDHYWWLTYEWRNLYYCCDICNKYKSSWFPVSNRRIKFNTPYDSIIQLESPLLIDPCIDRPEEHLVFSDDGRADFLTSKGKTTIQILKLNRSELISARESAVRELFGECEIAAKLFSSASKNRNRLKEIHESWEQLLSNYSVKPYSGIQRQMLSKWLSNNSNIQDYFAHRRYDDVELTKTVAVTGLKDDQIIADEIIQFAREKLSPIEREEIDKSINLEQLRHIYLERLEIKNFRCFEYLDVEFKESVGSIDRSDTNLSEPWLLFLGDNGVGKSSILKAIAICLMGDSYREKLVEFINIDHVLKHGKDDGYLKLYLKGEESPITVTFSEEGGIRSDSPSPRTYLLAYGSIRLPPRKRRLQAERGRGIVKAQNLFDYTISLVDAEEWLINRTDHHFDTISLALKDLMMLDGEDRIERNIETKEINIVRSHEQFKIQELSDGYQSVFALTVDIMATFLQEKITFDLAEGIVLIDEIGTHLHPRWKMEVVGQLRKTFPKIQFIVTTHEPLCLRGLKANETIVLTRNSDNGILAITDLPDPSELRVDQILTSEFFGLKSTIDPETERLFDEYYHLLSLDNRTEEQQNRILILSETIPRIKHLGDSLREELVYHVIDELLARRVKHDGLKLLEELKAEAINRVKGLWNLIDNK